jgi:hypothetical protein
MLRCRECPLCANRVILRRRKKAGHFTVSDEPPYGTSMPGAGAVHHINRVDFALLFSQS